MEEVRLHSKADRGRMKISNKESNGAIMINQVRNYVKDNKMLAKHDRIVVGVSGGADSVCLLLVLKELQEEYNLTLFVVHVNHGLRGQEARNDQEYVEQLCKELNIPCHSVSVCVSTVAKEQGYSLEEAGRILRYDAFQKEYTARGCNKIAIAHNKNDQAETILLNLARGSSIEGLTGIKAVRETVIRPLLGVTRSQIEEYLKEKGIAYCTDSTNLLDEYTRNKVRIHILPALSQVNEQAVSHIVNCAKQLSEIENYLKNTTNTLYQRMVMVNNGQYFVNVDELGKEDIVLQKRLVRLMMKQLSSQLKNIEEKHVLAVLSLCEKGVGKKVNLPYKMVAKRTYDHIVLGILPENVKENEKYSIPVYEEGRILPKEGEILLEDGEYFLEHRKYRMIFEVMEYKKNMLIPKNRCTKWFDYDKIKNTIFLRNRRQGDYLQFNASGNVKTIKSLFIDEKVPKEQRDNIPLLCDGDHVMWVVGNRISEAYKITEQSRKILVVKLMEV